MNLFIPSLSHVFQNIIKLKSLLNITYKIFASIMCQRPKPHAIRICDLSDLPSILMTRRKHTENKL
uniref:Uncharacterized protein n=1 Tax=Megaselia scalaris TaxID=36166 RepID=T1GFF1_MEGSC